MPSYDYKCPRCGCLEEVLHKMDSTEEIECPDCGEVMEKQISVTGCVQLKGEGFYVNDYPKNEDNE